MAARKAGLPSASKIASTIPVDESTAKGRALGAAADIGAEAAAGAAKGGAAGAALGAAKGAIQNKHSRKVLFRVVAVILVILMMAGVTTAVSIIAVVSSITGSSTEATNKAELGAQVPQSEIAKATRAVAGTPIPQSLYVAMKQTTGADPAVSKLSAALAAAHITGQSNNPAAGAIRTPQGTLKIGADSASAALADRTQKAYLAALTAYGLDQATAGQVFELARQFQLGAANTCGTSTTTAAGTGASATGQYSAAQVANIQQIIGIAKTMFPAAAEQAAVIGLATAAVESGFQNYANDTIPFSLTIPHDAVGRDHDSVGIMQQRAGGSWGAVGPSTWTTDPNGVVTRLMTPSFAAARFFDRLAGVNGWQLMEPGQAAQTVQVSARPDAYAGKVAAAQALWAQYGNSSPAIPVPTGGGTGQTAPGASTSPSSTVCSAPASNADFPSGPVKPGPWGGYGNGQIPLSALSLIPWDPSHGDGGKGTYLRPDAAAALGELNTAFTARFGYALPINDGYRDIGTQMSTFLTKGYPAAAMPGTSNHGWAMAIDIGTQSHGQLSEGSPEFAWLTQNAPAYGWYHFGSVGNKEAWHWQYYGKGGAPA